jgi:glucose/arabinose dehydrogenase
MLARTHQLDHPRAVAFAPDGSLVVAEAGSGVVRRVRFAPGEREE